MPDALQQRQNINHFTTAPWRTNISGTCTPYITTSPGSTPEMTRRLLGQHAVSNKSIAIEPTWSSTPTAPPLQVQQREVSLSSLRRVPPSRRLPLAQYGNQDATSLAPLKKNTQPPLELFTGSQQTPDPVWPFCYVLTANHCAMLFRDETSKLTIYAPCYNPSQHRSLSNGSQATRTSLGMNWQTLQQKKPQQFHRQTPSWSPYPVLSKLSAISSPTLSPRTSKQDQYLKNIEHPLTQTKSIRASMKSY